MKVNTKQLTGDYERTVKNIEAKPHVKYIRYLLAKQYSPALIKKELYRLGLSAPHEQPLTTYYMAVIDPVVSHFGLSAYYANYKNKLIRANAKSNEYSGELLNYRLVFGDDYEAQVKFCKFVKFLEIDYMWAQEIIKFYGSIVNTPTDEEGNRILNSTASTRGPSYIEKILIWEKRYMIDKMLLENVPIDRIAKYCRETYKFSVYDPDIRIYKAIFFNIQTQTIEDKIKALESERNSLKTLMNDVELGNGDYCYMSLGDKTILMEHTEKRIQDLENNIKGLNMLYTNAAVRIAEINEASFEDMFADVVRKSYERFAMLDREKDRDVVDPLLKTVRMMSSAHDKVEAIKAISDGSAGGRTNDKHSQSVILNLYSKRVDEIVDEQKNMVRSETGDNKYGDVDINDIAGIEDLSVSLKEDEADS